MSRTAEQGTKPYRIETDGGRATIVLDGREIPRATGWRMQQYAGGLPRLQVDITTLDITAHGDALPTYLIGGQEFTAADVEALMESPPDEPTLTDIARRFAAAMSLPDPTEPKDVGRPHDTGRA